MNKRRPGKKGKKKIVFDLSKRLVDGIWILLFSTGEEIARFSSERDVDSWVRELQNLCPSIVDLVSVLSCDRLRTQCIGTEFLLTTKDQKTIARFKSEPEMHKWMSRFQGLRSSANRPFVLDVRPSRNARKRSRLGKEQRESVAGMWRAFTSKPRTKSRRGRKAYWDDYGKQGDWWSGGA